MHMTKYRQYMSAFYPAGVFVLLVCLSMFLAAPGIAGAKADPDTGDEALIVLENGTGRRWSQLSRLNVFANPAYDGQPIIAPGSRGDYAFTIQNSTQDTLQYTLKITDENEARVPMKYRLRQDKKYLAGNENQWVDVSALSEITNELPHESEVVYTLEWCWLGENDNADTSVGIAGQNGTKYLLNFGITAELDENGELVDPVLPDMMPQTGDTINLSLWMAIAITSGILLMIFIPMKRNTNDENTENT